MPNIDIGNIFFRCTFSYRKVLKDKAVLDLLGQSQKCHYLCHIMLLDGNRLRILGCLNFRDFFSARASCLLEAEWREEDCGKAVLPRTRYRSLWRSPWINPLVSILCVSRTWMLWSILMRIVFQVLSVWQEFLAWWESTCLLCAARSLPF